MFQAIFEFVDENLAIIAATVLGAAVMGVLWAIKHPEDWYTWEEIDPDINTEAFTDDYKA